MYGQPPSSYQVTFGSYMECDNAKNTVLQEGIRLKAEAAARDEANRQSGIIQLTSSAYPYVSAACSEISD
jgi:hypothetical protein